MASWGSGYVTDVDYTYGYYKELSPLWAKHALLNAGFKFPQVITACELGFGQGITANFHAACSNVEWYGTDFNPSMAGFAQEMATASGANLKVFDDSFEEFSNREDIPDFDFIALHGIWSWVSEENRSLLLRFIEKKLKNGGVVYLSYNTYPGWSSFAPMRQIMHLHSKTYGSKSEGLVQQIHNAKTFANQLADLNPLFLKMIPDAQSQLAKLTDQDPHYLAHEFFNLNWKPIYFYEMAEQLESIKLEFACTASLLDQFDSVTLNEDQAGYLKGVTNTVMNQSLRDMFLNQNFRKDYWIKGAQRLTPLEKREAQLESKYVFLAEREAISLQIEGRVRNIILSEAIYKPILDAFSRDRILSVRQIFDSQKPSGITFSQLTEAINILCGMSILSPTYEEKTINSAQVMTDRLNEFLINKSRSRQDIRGLVSPVTGQAVKLNRVYQLFVGAIKAGANEPRDLAEYVWSILSVQSQKLVVNGTALESASDNLAELTRQATDFNNKLVPILRTARVL